MEREARQRGRGVRRKAARKVVTYDEGSGRKRRRRQEMQEVRAERRGKRKRRVAEPDWVEDAQWWKRKREGGGMVVEVAAESRKRVCYRRWMEEWERERSCKRKIEAGPPY